MPLAKGERRDVRRALERINTAHEIVNRDSASLHEALAQLGEAKTLLQRVLDGYSAYYKDGDRSL